MNLPNKLTMLRILLIPVFMVVLYWDFPGATWVAVAIFIIASFTDLLDGKIARKYNLVTDFGKFAERVCNQHNAVYYLHKSTAVHNERAYVKQPEVAFYTDKNIHTKRNKRTHNGNNRACFCRA